MALRQSKRIWICLVVYLGLAPAYGQEEVEVTDTAAVSYELPYNEAYHVDDSAQAVFESSEPTPELDRSHWRQLSRKLDFEEEKINVKDSIIKNPVAKDNGNGLSLPGFLKYLWIVIVAAILIIVIYKFMPALNRNNPRNKKDLLIDLDDLDEESIRELDVETPLGKALREDDYRTAYRLRYLAVLKELIGRNMIFYKKEKTNYEYLLQLSGLPVYEPFRLLTFSFDGIWYGDLFIDKAAYEALEAHFKDFQAKIGI